MTKNTEKTVEQELNTKYNPIVLAVYDESITAQALEELREEYPADEVIDMSPETGEENFKKARKDKTRRNKLTKAIKDKGLEISGQIKARGDELQAEVNSIFSNVVDQFEKEDAERKAEAARLKAEREKLLTKQRAQINEIRGFIDNARGKSSQEIADTLEAIDLVETDVFDKELIHEAIDVKKSVIEELHQLLNDTRAREATEKERQQLAEEMEREKKRAEVQSRIMKLQSIPMELLGKTSAEVSAKIASISKFAIKEEDFPGRVAEVEAAKTLVLNQLDMMKQQAEMVEAAALVKQSAQQEQQAAEQQAAAEHQAAEQARIAEEQAKAKAEQEKQAAIAEQQKVVEEHQAQESKGGLNITKGFSNPFENEEVTLTQSDLNAMLHESYVEGWNDGVKAGKPYAE